VTYTGGNVEGPRRLGQAHLPGGGQRHQPVGVAVEQQGRLLDTPESLGEGPRSQEVLGQGTGRRQVGAVEGGPVGAVQEPDLGGNQVGRDAGRVGATGVQDPMHRSRR
jgi:hypothetical protein